MLTGEKLIERICPECQIKFFTNRHNKKYCTKVCCVNATNKTILQRYHENKKLKDKKRRCANSDCNSILSSYNQEDVCSLCKKRAEDVKRIELLKELGFFDYIQE